MRVFAGVAVLVVVLLLACGGGGDGGNDGASGDEGGNSPQGQGGRTSSGPIDACAHITEAAAEALLGGDVGDTQKTPAGPFQSCGYYAASGLLNFVQVQACRCLQGSQFDASMRSGAEALGVTAKPVSGVGDKAYWLEGILWVQKGDYAINLWISAPSVSAEGGQQLEGEALERKALPRHVEVAKQALSRLP
jgi:hypothetical protein